MDKQSALRREMVLVEVGAVSVLSIACWLLPKHFQMNAWQQGITGAMSAGAMVAAGYRVGRLEIEERMDRALMAAQQDLFTSELATDVYLGQLQHQQLIHAATASHAQAQKTENQPPQKLQAPPQTGKRQEQAQQIEPVILCHACPLRFTLATEP